MKTYTITIVTLLLFQATYSANELSWVDTQVNAIKPARVGMNDSEILKIQDPFIFYKKDSTKDNSRKKSPVVKYSSIKQPASNSSETTVTKTTQSMKLNAIINNSALINGEWYRVDQNIAGFTVSSISRTSVVLTKGNQKLVLTTNDQNRNLKFK